MRCRLDYFLIPKHYSDAVQTCSIIPGILTDHMLIEIRLRINKLVREHGLWKLNNSLLDDEEYVQKINNVIESIWHDNQNIVDLRVRFF